VFFYLPRILVRRTPIHIETVREQSFKYSIAPLKQLVSCQEPVRVGIKVLSRYFKKFAVL